MLLDHECRQGRPNFRRQCEPGGYGKNQPRRQNAPSRHSVTNQGKAGVPGLSLRRYHAHGQHSARQEAQKQLCDHVRGPGAVPAILIAGCWPRSSRRRTPVTTLVIGSSRTCLRKVSAPSSRRSPYSFLGLSCGGGADVLHRSRQLFLLIASRSSRTYPSPHHSCRPSCAPERRVLIENREACPPLYSDMNRTWSNSFRPVSGRRRLNGRRGLKQRSAPVEKKAGKHPNADTDRQAGKRSLGNTRSRNGIDSMGSFRLNAVGPFANAVLQTLRCIQPFP